MEKKSFRNLLGCLAANVLITTGFVKFATKRALKKKCILSLYFHKPSKSEFEFCVQWLKIKGFKFLSIHDMERIMKEEIPFPQGAVLLTLDDGWQSNVTNVVEVANRYRVPVTIFVSTKPVEEGAYWWSYVHQACKKGLIRFSKKELKKMPDETRLGVLKEIKKKIFPGRDAMTVDQVKSIAESPYITIGSHTVTHPILTNCNEMKVYEELKLSRQKLESWIGKEVACFAYPNGDFSPREVQVLKTLNYRLAFSSQPRYLTPESLKDNFTLPRFGFLEGASTAENICRMAGIWQPMMLKLFHYKISKPEVNKRIPFNKMPSGVLRLQDVDNSTHVI